MDFDVFDSEDIELVLLPTFLLLERKINSNQDIMIGDADHLDDYEIENLGEIIQFTKKYLRIVEKPIVAIIS